MSRIDTSVLCSLDCTCASVNDLQEQNKYIYHRLLSFGFLGQKHAINKANYSTKRNNKNKLKEMHPHMRIFAKLNRVGRHDEYNCVARYFTTSINILVDCEMMFLIYLFTGPVQVLLARTKQVARGI